MFNSDDNGIKRAKLGADFKEKVENNRDKYPLSLSLIQANQERKSFREWIDSIPEELVDKYADHEKHEDQQDVVMASVIWLYFRYKDVNKYYSENQIVKRFSEMRALMSLLSVEIKVNKHFDIRKELISADVNEWYPENIHVISYCSETPSTIEDVIEGFVDGETPKRIASLSDLALTLTYDCC